MCLLAIAPGRDTGGGQTRAVLLGHRRGGHDATTRMEQQDVVLVAGLRQSPFEGPRVGADDRDEGRVRDRRGESFVLEDLGQDVTRRGDRHPPGKLLGEDLRHAVLVGRVGERVHETHSDGFDLATPQDAGHVTGASSSSGSRTVPS